MIKALVLLLLVSCGPDHEHKAPTQDPQPWPGNGGSGSSDGDDGGSSGGGGSGTTKPSYQETQALLQTYCAPCHGGARFMSSESELRASSVLSRVRSRGMPTVSARRKLPDAERTKILNFF